MKKAQSAKDKELSNIQEISVPLFKRHYIKVSAIITMILWIIGTTYFLINYFYLAPLEKQLSFSHTETDEIKSKNIELKSQIHESEIAIANIKLKNQQPILIFPKDGSSYIGNRISFVWENSGNSEDQKYVLEVFEPCTRVLKRINVIHPELLREFFTFEDSSIHEILWRIRPGQILGDKIISSGFWSSSNRLTVYPSLVSKLKNTKTLQIATTPSSYGPFTKSDGQGNYSGFDLDLIKYIIQKLSTNLRIPDLQIEIDEIQWKDLLTSINNGEYDMGIKAITKTREREKEYSNISFSNGYLNVDQVFIQQKNRPQNFPNFLNNVTIGVKKNSTNEILARKLSHKYSFNIDNEYINYGDLYEALSKGEIDYAVVDYPLVADFIKRSDFYLASPAILNSEYLKEVVGYDSEQYSIAIYNPDSKNDLINLVNQILSDPDTKVFIESLKTKYNFKLAGTN